MSKPASNPKSDTAESAALEVFGLGFHYDAKAALSHVGFDVAAGRFKVLLGPNGAGKSTLFSLITRLFESPSGTITVNRVGLREDFLQALARDDGIAVRWATHPIDEISDDDDVMILHEGRVLADGSLADVLKKAKAEDIAGAFDALTGGGGR